ncbi:MAG: hypothetical protein ACYDB7_01320 [Mycobacteriales bacterium]
MQFQGAVVKEQGTTFGIIIVKPPVLTSPLRQSEWRAFGTRAFGLMPIVLMAQDSRGVPTYVGRRDIVAFLSKVFIQQIPWKRYSVSTS